MADHQPYVVLVFRSAQRDFARLHPDARERVRTQMVGLASDPRGQSEKLAGATAYRKRVGDYRIVFRIDDLAREVLVTRVKHRREVYRR